MKSIMDNLVFLIFMIVSFYLLSNIYLFKAQKYLYDQFQFKANPLELMKIFKNNIILTLSLISTDFHLRKYFSYDAHELGTRKNLIFLILSPMNFIYTFLLMFLVSRIIIPEWNFLFLVISILNLILLAWALYNKLIKHKVIMPLYPIIIGLIFLFATITEFDRVSKVLSEVLILTPDSQWLWFLTSNQWSDLVLLLLMSALLASFSHLKGLLPLLGVYFLAKGWISINGIWFIFLGDYFAAHIIKPVLRLPKYYQFIYKNHLKMAMTWILLSVLSLLLVVILFSSLRSEFVFFINTGIQGDLKIYEALMWISLIPIVHTFIVSIWGHFYYVFNGEPQIKR